MIEYRYELKVVDHVEYNGFAGVSFFYFKSGDCLPIAPASHSDQERFLPNTTVLIRFRKTERDEFPEGLAKVTRFQGGCPTEFGDSLSNGWVLGSWQPPAPNELICDNK